MDYDQIALLMLAIGLGVLIAEIFIPSGGVLLAVTLLCLGVSFFCAWKAWWGTEPTYWWTYVGGVMLLIPSVTVLAFYIFPRTRFGRRVLLEAPDADQLAPYAAERERLSHLVGATGQAVTPLSPGGLVTIDGDRFHSISEGAIIESGERVKVVEIRGTRLVVRAVKEEVGRPDVFLTDLDEPDSPALDFELPQD